jgi:hypothetical protein
MLNGFCNWTLRQNSIQGVSRDYGGVKEGRA